MISEYRDTSKDSALSNSIQDLLTKNVIERVEKPDSLGLYSHLFLVPKPENRWIPVIDLSSLNQFLSVPKFKMETPESIRSSLRKGEWVTSRMLIFTSLSTHSPGSSSDSTIEESRFQAYLLG